MLCHTAACFNHASLVIDIVLCTAPRATRTDKRVANKMRVSSRSKPACGYLHTRCTTLRQIQLIVQGQIHHGQQPLAIALSLKLIGGRQAQSLQRHEIGVVLAQAQQVTDLEPSAKRPRDLANGTMIGIVIPMPKLSRKHPICYPNIGKHGSSTSINTAPLNQPGKIEKPSANNRIGRTSPQLVQHCATASPIRSNSCPPITELHHCAVRRLG